MSGSIARTVGVRISTEGADRARRELEQFGAAGEAALRRVNAASIAASSSMQTMAGASDALVHSLGGLPGPLGTVGRQIGVMQAGLGGVSGGFNLAAAAGAAMGTALVSAFSASVAAAEKFERLSLRTEAVIKATGGAAGLSAQQIRTLSQEIARSTLASTADVEAAAQQLLTFRSVAGETFARTLRAAQDLASVGFGTIDSAAVQLGKALENPTEGLGALTRVGVTFTSKQKELIESLMATGRVAEAQRVILAAVEQQVGGAGRAEAGGLAGAFDTLGQNVEEFLQRIGNTGPLQAATWAIDKVALAVKGLDDALKVVVEQPNPVDAAMAAVQAAQRRLAAVQAQNRAERSANAYGDLPRAFQQAEMVAHEELTLALARLEEVREAARREAASREAQAAAARATAEREASETAIKALEQSLDQRLKLRADYQKRLGQIDEAERTGARTAQEAAALRVQVTAAYTKALNDLDRAGQRATASAEREEAQRAKALDKLERQRNAAERMLAATLKGSDAIEALSVQLEIENQLREIGISVTKERTAAEDAYAQAVTQTITATKSAEEMIRKINDARREADQRVKSTTDDVVRYASDRFADLFSQTGRGWAGLMDDFYRLARVTFARIAAEAVIRPIVTPIVQGIFGSGGIGDVGGVATGGGLVSLFGLGNIGETLGLTGPGGLLSSIGSSLGLTGTGGLLSTTVIPGLGTSTSAALGAMGGAYGPASLAQLQAFGGGGLLGSGATVGTLLGGAGAGFGAGMLLNSLLRGNQTGGMIGSGVGSAAGAVLGSIIPGIGTLIGGLLGGLAGGGLGGLFGPKESVRGFGLRLQSEGFFDGQDQLASALKPIDRTYFNESGAALFQQADQLVAAVNAYLAQRNLLVGGVSIIGGNKKGTDYSWADAGSLSEAFTRLRFSSQDSPELASALSGKVFDDPAKLQQFVEGFYSVKAAIEDLTDTPAQKLQKTLDAIGRQFDELSAKAREYGLSESGLAEARARALAEAAAQQKQTNAGGNLLAELAFGSQSALAPEQRYFAALSLLNDAKDKLSAGGGLDDFVQIARQVLPVARDFLGTSERYASLVADVAGAVTSRGGDTSGLGALLQAQVDGSDALRETFARYGERQLDVANATLAEFRRLASAIEAMLARRTAA
jgi:hypothetical protein